LQIFWYARKISLENLSKHAARRILVFFLNVPRDQNVHTTEWGTEKLPQNGAAYTVNLRLDLAVFFALPLEHSMFVLNAQARFRNIPVK
jgi:hypothetical protein